MIREERMDCLVQLLREHKYLSVDFLVQTLHYSPATVRRDIKSLVAMGYARKSYGGVSLNEQERPFIIREHEYPIEKEEICRAAAHLICDHDVVFIAGSSTTEHLEKILAEKTGITVVTNDPRLAAVTEKMGHKSICTGGVMKDGMMVGSLGVQCLSQMHYDVCFFSPTGLSDAGELSFVSEEFGYFIQKAIERSEKRVCLCTANKLGVRAFFCGFDLSAVTHVISNADVGVELKETFERTVFLTVHQQI